MKSVIYFMSFLCSFHMLFGQELFLQGSDLLRGSEKVDGQEYDTVYDNESHVFRYFDKSGKEIFLIKSFNENGDQIALSIEKNTETNNLELIMDNTPIGVLVNSIIYDLNGVEIGCLFRGRYSKSNLTSFWGGLDHHYGNISIYDYTCVYKVGSFMFKEEVDYYAVLGVDRIGNVDEMDPRLLKKKVRNIERFYKKIIKKYDIKKYPNDDQIKQRYMELSNAYQEVMSDLGVDKKKEQKILGILPKEYLSQDRRANWSQDEGYVPYTKREVQQHKPASQIQKEEFYKTK